MTDTCDNCVFARWRRTAAGRLHPDRSGMCKRLEAFPLDLRLPAAFGWGSYGQPDPYGGYIERGYVHVDGCAFKYEAWK